MTIKGKTLAQYCEVSCILLKESPSGKAFLIDHGTEEAVWVPKSQIQNHPDELEEGASVDLLIPKWLATEKGLI